MNTQEKAVVEIEQKTTQVDVVHQKSESAAIFSMIARLAEQPNIDLDRMERLIAMRDKELDRIARGNFNEAMAAAQAEIPQVVRDAKNDHTRSKYATYEAVSSAMQPIINKHGFALSFSEGCSDVENSLKIICDVSHGSYEKRYEAVIPIDGGGMRGNSNKNATQAYGSTITYGRRYLKTMIFDVAIKDQDNDAQSAKGDEIISQDQFEILNNLLDSNGIDKAKFCTYMEVEAIANIPANNFQKALTAINKSIHQKAQANG